MTPRQDLIHAEASALWKEVFGEEPAIEADGQLMLSIVLAHLELKPYSRLAAARRARNLVFATPEDGPETRPASF